jgi:hypothetical protein
MPITATAAKGVANIIVEANPGEQQLLIPTAITATITGITAPSGSTGMRLHIKLTNFTASGSFTINGTGVPGNSETFTVAALTQQQVQSGQMANFEIVSVNAYTALTNITTTGLTNGIIAIYGIQAGKYALPSTIKSKRTPKIYSPNEHNALIERDKKVVQLIQNTTIDEIKQDVYADISLWWPYVIMGAPASTATIPSTPASLLSATSITSTMSLTTQPTAPGMKIILAITAFTTPGTLTLTGTVNGVTNVSESISITGNGTYYSSNVYSAINASGITNASTVATLAVTGVFGWQYTFLSGAAQYSAVVEWYDGTGSWTHPFSIFEEGTFDAKVQSEISLTGKGKAQDRLPIGDRTTTPLSGTNRIAALGVNLNDLPIVGWQTQVYLDAITGTPLTTQNVNIEELKVDLKVPQEDHFTFVNTQSYNRAYPVKRSCTATVVFDFIDLLQYEQFRQNLKQYLAVQFLGQYIGTSSGTAYYKSWTWTLPVRSDGGFDVTSDPSKGSVVATSTWQTEYDSGIGGAYKLAVISQMPPNYTA